MRTITIKIETDSEESFDLIKDDIERELSCCCNWTWFDKVEISEEIKGDSDAPTADVPDRKVGKWIEPTREGGITFDKHAYAECSACGGKSYLGWWMHYCPNCGARMENE